MFKLLLATVLTALPLIGLTQDFKPIQLADGLSHPWSIALISADDMLITEKTGTLKRFTKGTLTPINGTPESFVRGQGGLLDVVLAPDFSTSQVLYLSYSEGSKDDNGVSISRYKLVDNTLTEGTLIFRQSSRRSTPAHYGGRIAFIDDQRLMLTTGDAYNNREDAQKADSELGKTILIDVVEKTSAIYSLGHRNPQGLVYDKGNNRLYLHEHGPKGGDEVNLISKGANYGWPLATYGVDYSGAQITPYDSFKGTEAPKVNWTPSIAPSGMTLYQGEQFQRFNGKLLVGSLKFKEIYLVDPTQDQTNFPARPLTPKIDERVRDIRSVDGRIFIVTDSDNGKLIELVTSET